VKQHNQNPDLGSIGGTGATDITGGDWDGDSKVEPPKSRSRSDARQLNRILCASLLVALGCGDAGKQAEELAARASSASPMLSTSGRMS
jgi:hypothetical protein